MYTHKVSRQTQLGPTEKRLSLTQLLNRLHYPGSSSTVLSLALWIGPLSVFHMILHSQKSRIGDYLHTWLIT